MAYVLCLHSYRTSANPLRVFWNQAKPRQATPVEMPVYMHQACQSMLLPQIIVALHSGMRAIGFWIVTDMCLPDALKPADVSEIIRIAGGG